MGSLDPPGGKKGGVSVYLLADQSSTYVFSILMFSFSWGSFVIYVYLLLVFCFLFRRLKVSILSLQTASPNFKNNGFIKEILTFLKNHSFVLEDWFGSFLGLFLAHFGWSWGSFVEFLGLLDRPNRVSRFALEL